MGINMNYRILQLIGGGEIGGAEIHLLNLILNTDKDKADFHLGCLCKESPLACEARKKQIKTTLFPMSYTYDLMPIPDIVTYCKENKIDLIHAHGIRADFLGRLSARFAHIPCISTVHSLWQNDYSSSWKGKLALYIEKLTMSLSSGLITISQSLHDSLLTLLTKKQVKQIPQATIFNGCPLLDFGDKADLRHKYREKWQISENTLVVGTIGRLHPVKGHIDLFRALELLENDYPNLHFLLIGDGILYDDLKGLLQTSSLNYTMPGYLSDAWQALPAMDLFVLPSVHEGMGLVLLEAIQAGIPIVATYTGGIPELLSNETDALLVPPSSPHELAAACRKILNNPQFAKDLVNKAYEKLSSYTINQMVEKTLIFYQTVIEKNSHQ
jgi:glycosyltransferase involved in cell wall biosynthesis